MPLPRSRKDREQQKFVDDGSGNVALRAVVVGGGGGSPAGSDTELQYNNAGSFGGTTDLNFLAGLGLSIQGGLSYGWNTTETAFGLVYTQQGIIAPQNFTTQNISTETVGTDILTNTLDFAVQPTSFQIFGQFTSSDFPATNVGYSFIVSKNEMVYSLGTSGATGPNFILNYDTAAQANGDVFNFDFKGRNDLTASTKYAGIRTTVINATAAAEVGRLSLSTIVAGVDTVGLSIENGQVDVTGNMTVTPSGIQAFAVNGIGEVVKVTDTITASVTQTQGQEPLVSSYNIVTVVANANDTVTLPTAVAGQIVRIKNEGANTLQVFPALGNSVNNGAVDASVTQATATFFMYIADDATNYTRVQLTIA